MGLLKNRAVNFSWPYLLRDLSVWFNVRLTVIGFRCLPLITSENWGGQFILWMHIKRHQKWRSWRPASIIKAFYISPRCVIVWCFSCVCVVCVLRGWQLLEMLSVFSLFSVWTDLSQYTVETFLMLVFFSTNASSAASLTHTLFRGQFASEWWCTQMLYVIYYFTPITNSLSFLMSSYDFTQ